MAPSENTFSDLGSISVQADFRKDEEHPGWNMKLCRKVVNGLAANEKHAGLTKLLVNCLVTQP